MSSCELDTTLLPAQVTAPGQFGGPFQDVRGNPLPAGTTVAFSTTNGTLQGTTTFTYPNTLAVQAYGVTVLANAPSSSGSLTITLTCPNSGVFRYQVPVDD
jgi:hypothetical protein